MRMLVIFLLIVGVIWAVLDETKGKKTISNVLTGKTPVDWAKTMTSLKFIGFFIVAVIIANSFIGTGVTMGLLLLVLASMLVVNSDKVTALLGGSKKG